MTQKFKSQHRFFTKLGAACSLFVIAIGCSEQRSKQRPQFEGLSQGELEQLATSKSDQQILVVDGDGVTKSLNVSSVSIAEIQSQLATEAAAQGLETRTVVLNASVEIEKDLAPDKANAGLLFSGKEEFGMSAWRKKFPNADGRGIVAGVVDDGVAPLRPGLLTTSTGVDKISLSLNNSSLWRVPLEQQTCLRKDIEEVSQKIAKWTSSASDFALPAATEMIPFQLSSCGTHPQMALGMSCDNWSNYFSKEVLKAVISDDGIVKFPAAVAKSGDDAYRVFVDFNADGKLDSNETTLVKKGAAGKLSMASNATAFVFSYVDAKQSVSSQDPLMSPSVCPNGIATSTPELHVRPPESQSTSGSHGEGVASVLAGHALPAADSKTTFDGVAPGAQVVDVQLTLDGDIPYSIHSVGQALRLAGLNSNVVNLSYSLYFSTPTAQISMKRYLDAVLKDTKALYFFSGGNNGPGRGSMNRKGIYPKHSIVSGAYLNAAMSQSVFGSATPWGGVVTYSSRGPGPDGSVPVDVVSPLAATTASTADGGFRDFSGTSSASPAMAGFAALLASGVVQAGYDLDRELLKKAILDSGTQLKNTPAIDQGAGLPNLLKAFELYEKMFKGKRLETHPTLATGAVFLKDSAGKKPFYSLLISPQFSDAVSESARANYTEQLKLVPNSDWIQTPQDLILSRAGESVQIAIDDSKLPKKGEAIGEIQIISELTGELRGTLPVTLLIPDSRDWTAKKSVTVAPASIVRFFLTKPAAAKQLIVAGEEEKGNFCGYFQVYGPTGQKMTAVDAALAVGFSKREAAFSTPLEGVYEVVMTGMGSHTICPKTQKISLKTQWLGLAVSADEVSKSSRVSVVLDVQNSSNLPLEGSFILEKPAEVQSINLTPSTTTKGLMLGAPVKLLGNESWTLDESFLQNQFFGLPSFDLYLRPLTLDLNRRRDVRVSLSAGNWTDQSLLLQEQIGSEFTPHLALFEYGGMGLSQGDLSLKIRRQISAESGISLTSAHAAMLSGANKVSISGSVDFEKTPLGVRTFSCLFKPAGFQSAVSCGDLTLAF